MMAARSTPGNGLQNEMRHGRERAGVAGADTCERAAFLDQIDGHAHGRLLLAPNGFARRVVHGHDFRGVDELYALPERCWQNRLEQRCGDGGVAHRERAQVPILIERAREPRDVVARLAVAAHHVDGYGLHASDPPRRASGRKGGSSAYCCSSVSAGFSMTRLPR